MPVFEYIRAQPVKIPSTVHHRNANLFSPPNTIPRTATHPTGKRETHVGSQLDHLLIANDTGSLTLRIPLGGVSFFYSPGQPTPIAREGIGTPRFTVDYRDILRSPRLVNVFIQRPIDGIAVFQVSTTGD